MNRFEQVQLWQNTLAKQLDPDKYEKQRELLRIGFEEFRERAKVLATEISSNLPEFTVHDITHIDALWETANIILGNEIKLNPAEAFVLGGAFLIHDLGMGLAAYPKGIEELKKEPIWLDTISATFRKKYSKPIQKKDFKNLDSEIEKNALENVLRLLHAKQAENLGLTKWKNQNGDDQFLIEKTELRESYGNIIGLIAHSHWWSVDELEKKLPPILGAPSIFSPEWTVDPIKLACILRVADAIQIDDRRAPSFLRTIRKPSSYSDKHWNFQLKLYQPRIERNRIIFSSKSPFKINEVDSWWICYDTLKMIDKELKEVDSLLADTNRNRLNAIGVASIEDPVRLSKLITVENWQPVDTKIKVSNVAKLVGSLGGKQLYGDNILVPIRELIQNSSDAIRARRLLEGENEEFGTIHIELGKDNEGNYIEIYDNGVGMSPKVLTGPFLDFGESFWGTSIMHEELPGLESKGFSSTGQYGIGFFSVFMLGEKVSVTSKRFEDARGNSLTLEFSNGVSSRPILRPASNDEIIKDGGTKIKVWLDTKIIEKLLKLKSKNHKKISLSELVETLCPSIDCNIDVSEKGKTKRIINSNDWVSISSINLLKRIIGRTVYNSLSKKDKQFAKKLAENMEIVEDDDYGPVARGFIFKQDTHRKRKGTFPDSGIVTLGGLRSCDLTGLIGIFKGSPARASRDIGIPIISFEGLEKWATSQAKLLHKLELDFETQIDCSSVIRVCGGSTEDLKVVHHKTGCLNYKEMIAIIKQLNLNQYLIVQDAAISNYEQDNNCKIDINSNVIWVSMGTPGILQTRNRNHFIWWPEKRAFFGDEETFSASLEGLTTMALCEHWNCSIPEINSSSKISSDKKRIDGIIGMNKDKEVLIDYLDIMIKPK
ncbi:ATP-binding protein [Tenacibaculum ovolyticum]|uniref:HD domain-containing protein n=1 Tax=Tenacibaculum ovolyticum TaxID=104270 RepID=UPI0022F39932|nr:ATP-binding protein [Tenacibaculum ovolyticum]WBX78371.1 ATP-binding protein [Tenacibaculum ovolyticum]